MPDADPYPVPGLDPPESPHLLLKPLLLRHPRVGHLHRGGAEILDAAPVAVLHGHEILEVSLPAIVVRGWGLGLGALGSLPGALGALPSARRAVPVRVVAVVVVVAGLSAGR